MKLISKPYRVTFNSNNEWACLVQLDNEDKVVLNITDDLDIYFLVSVEVAKNHLQYPDSVRIMTEKEIKKIHDKVNTPDNIIVEDWNEASLGFVQIANSDNEWKRE